MSGEAAANEEASAVAWFTPGELVALDIHPTQRRQLADWLNGAYPVID